MTPTPSTTPEGTTYRPGHLAVPMIVVGALLTAVAVVAAISNSPLSGIGAAGVLLLVMGIWKQKGNYVSLYADHLTAKVAPAAGRKAILYSEIVAVSRKGSRLIIKYHRHTDVPSGKPRQLTLRLGELASDQRSAFVDQLRGKLPDTVFNDAWVIRPIRHCRRRIGRQSV